MHGMNTAYLTVLAASEDDKRALFLSCAGRLGTAVQHVEKDFWVCWTLDALFNGPRGNHPRLLFKGGTSLSKAYNLIERFSEDVDITVFRDDLGHPTSIEELTALSGKKRQIRLDSIKAACQAYIGGPFRDHVESAVREMLRQTGMDAGRARVVLDEEDPDRQTLLFWYPSVINAGAYVRSAVKIEAGAKSALDPHHVRTVTPYIAEEVPSFDLQVKDVVTVDPERTFWDKVIILHGTRRWFERRGNLRQDGQRVSRHYYDVFRLTQFDVGQRAASDRALGLDCARHARLFFYRPDLDLDHAVPGTFALAPTSALNEVLRRDYEAMAGMIFGAIPSFETVTSAVERLEVLLNT
jgi:hypothetical protein